MAHKKMYSISALARYPELLARVTAGEELLLSAHGIAVARLVPLNGPRRDAADDDPFSEFAGPPLDFTPLPVVDGAVRLEDCSPYVKRLFAEQQAKKLLGGE